MSDEPRAGDAKKCPKCRHLMLTLTMGLETETTVVLYANESWRQETVYKDAWHCENCGYFELLVRKPPSNT